MGKTSILIDYSVLDHLLRIEQGTYTGRFLAELEGFRSYCASGRGEIWIAEISDVEMIHGRENPMLNSQRLAEIEKKDQRKHEIAKALGAYRLGYPCSKLGDAYSRLNVSFRTAGPNWSKAEELENRLLAIDGVSPGDARQLVTAIYGHDDRNPDEPPNIEFIVTEDVELRRAIDEATTQGLAPEFRGTVLLSVADFMAAQQAHPARRADARA